MKAAREMAPMILGQVGIGLIKTTLALGGGWLTYCLLAPVAYAERGYLAFGGECALAVIASLVLMWALFLRPIERQGNLQETVPEVRILPAGNPNCRHQIYPIFHK